MGDMSLRVKIEYELWFENALLSMSGRSIGRRGLGRVCVFGVSGNRCGKR